MRCRYLGWAGLELEHEGATLVIDPLRDADATFAGLGEATAGIALPELTPPHPGALAGLLTHLHRDHADAGALAEALADGGPVLGPRAAPGTRLADAGLLQARADLEAARLDLRGLDPGDNLTLGPFIVTALPAADGLGDPQLSWAVEAGNLRILHAGDTMFHGWWWRAAQAAGPFDAAFLPINGAVLGFPHRQPASALPAVMTPEQAVQAARALGAARAVPMHFGAFDVEPFYRSISDAPERFARAAAQAGVPAHSLGVGATLEL